MADEGSDISFSEPPPVRPEVVIAGFGVPGRYLAELLDERRIPYSVIEQNPTTAKRCTTVRIFTGDVRDEITLRRAGLMHAHTIALTLPNEPAVLEAIALIRHLRRDIRIMARCNFTSGGFKAQQLGADMVMVAEQLVGEAFYRSFNATLVTPAADTTLSPVESIKVP